MHVNKLIVEHIPTWAELFEAIGASAAVLAALGGLVAALRYGRRANVEVQAHAYQLGTGIIIAVRPSVRAVGIFSLDMKGPGGAEVRVTEVLRKEEGLEDGESWPSMPIFKEEELVVSGETITTSVVIDVGPPGE